MMCGSGKYWAYEEMMDCWLDKIVGRIKPPDAESTDYTSPGHMERMAFQAVVACGVYTFWLSRRGSVLFGSMVVMEIRR